MDVCLRVLKESNKSRFDSYSVKNSVLIISHITFRIVACTFFSDNLSRSSCILKQLFTSVSINIKTFSPLAFFHLSSIISVNQLIIDNYSPKAKLILLNNPQDENYSNSFALYYGYLYTEFPRWRRLGLFPLFTLWVQHLLFVFKRTTLDEKTDLPL